MSSDCFINLDKCEYDMARFWKITLKHLSVAAFQQVMHPYADKKTTVQSHAVYNKLRLVAATAAASGLDQTKP